MSRDFYSTCKFIHRSFPLNILGALANILPTSQHRNVSFVLNPRCGFGETKEQRSFHSVWLAKTRQSGQHFRRRGLVQSERSVGGGALCPALLGLPGGLRAADSEAVIKLASSSSSSSSFISNSLLFHLIVCSLYFRPFSSHKKIYFFFLFR